MVNKGMFELLEPNDLVLIVAKCIVNSSKSNGKKLSVFVLIVAKCIVNIIIPL